RTRRDARSFIPFHASSVQPMTIVLDPPIQGQARRYGRENRHKARGAPPGRPHRSGKQEAPSSQASRKFHPGTHCLRVLKQTFDRQVRRKKNSLGFLGIPRKKSDSRKFISVFSRDSTY